MNLLIVNAYSARNRGDAAILLGMAASFTAAAGKTVRLTVASDDPGYDRNVYPFSVVPSWLAREPRNGYAAAAMARFLLRDVPRSLGWAMLSKAGRNPFRWRAKTPLLQAYEAADLVVSAGGGYLYTRSATRGNGVLFARVWAYLLGVLMGKPAYLYAQSIGPFASPAQAWLVRSSLQGVQRVEVRERESLREIEKWGLAPPVSLAVDAALALPAGRHKKSRPFRPTPLKIGMTVRRWYHDNPRQAGYEKACAGFCAWLCTELGASVCFLPQVTFSERDDDDRVIARRVVMRAGCSGASTIEQETDPAGIIERCETMDYFVGTRMHSNLFAAMAGVPVLALAYQPKTVGMMAELGLSEWVLPIEKVSVETLKRSFLRLQARGNEIKRHLEKRIPILRAEALNGARAICRDYFGRARKPSRL